MFKRGTLLAIPVLFSFLLAGCGEEKAPEKPATPGPAAGAPAADKAAAPAKPSTPAAPAGAGKAQRAPEPI